MARKVGENVDGWILKRFIDEGGTADVWEAERDGKTYALKILKNPDVKNDRYKRFRLEAELGKKKYDGVLPMVDACIPEKPNDKKPAWIAFPVATTAQKQLGVHPPLRDVVEACHSLAATLAGLVEQGINHRDVKPANLFFWDDRWWVGDLGLVAFSGKESFTEEGKGLGPRGFFPDEVFSNPTDYAKGPMDVFCMAKTLWVLAKGQNYPPQGPLDPSNARDALQAEFPTERRAYKIDLLLERATRRDPAQRPTMKEFADELGAWLAPATPGPHMNEEKDAEIAEELKALASGDEVRAAEDLRQSKLVEALRQNIAGKLGPLQERVAKILKVPGIPPHARFGHPRQVGATTPAGWGKPASELFGGRPSMATDLNFVGGIVAAAYGDEVYLSAAYRLMPLAPDAQHTEVAVFDAHRKCPLGSAQEEQELASLVALLVKELDGALKKYAATLRERRK